MDLKEKIQKDLKLSLLDKDKKRTAALRLLLSDIKNAEIEKGEKLDEGEIFQVINSERKKWTTAIEQFEKAGDMERAEKEKNDIKI
ncbi:MAG: GatB/YqeY domain-containing protein, partial [Actinomycetia bacterium]|nr:GatB/YqeY domain-containing protein [Actinomycetes bacterium]